MQTIGGVGDQGDKDFEAKLVTRSTPVRAKTKGA
jgi:hypothetical protein